MGVTNCKRAEAWDAVWSQQWASRGLQGRCYRPFLCFAALIFTSCLPTLCFARGADICQMKPFLFCTRSAGVKCPPCSVSAGEKAHVCMCLIVDFLIEFCAHTFGCSGWTAFLNIWQIHKHSRRFKKTWFPTKNWAYTLAKGICFKKPCPFVCVIIMIFLWGDQVLLATQLEAAFEWGRPWSWHGCG